MRRLTLHWAHVTPSALTPELRTWVERQLAAVADDGDLRTAVQRLGKRHDAAIVGASPAYIYFLRLDGQLLRLDVDELRQELEPVAAHELRDVLAEAITRHPELAELLPR